MNKRLRYKNFKKVHEDAHSATLQHPEGHTIKIAKGVLSDHLKKQVSALPFADGGEVPDKEQMTAQHRIDVNGNVVPYKPEQIRHAPSTSLPPKTNDREVNSSAKSILGYADGGAIDEPHGGMSMPNGQELEPSAEQQAPNITAQMANMHLPAQVPQGPTNPVIPVPAQQPALPQQPNYAEQGMGQQLQGIAGQAQAESKLGKGETAAAQQNTNKLNELDVIHQHNQQRIQSELDNAIHDYNQGKIDPNHFWNSKSTLGKASTAIGLILGGMGAGIGGGENPVLSFINQQIDRDVESQKADAGRKMNTITALQHQFGNNIDATNMAKAMQAGVFASKLMEEAAKSKDPLALSRAQQASGQILATYGPLVQQTALRQTILQGMKQGSVSPAEAIPHIITDHADKAKAFEEVRHIENQKKAIKTVSDTLDQIDKVQSGTNRVFSPLQSRSQINALNLQIAGLGKEIFGRLNEQELKMLADNHYELTDDAKTRAVKKQNIINMMSKDVSHPVLDSYHIPIKVEPQFHK